MLKEFCEGIWIDPKSVVGVSRSIGSGSSDKCFDVVLTGAPLLRLDEHQGKTYQDFIAWLEECEMEKRRIDLKTFERLMDKDPALTVKVKGLIKDYKIDNENEDNWFRS
jgi:hypothetical protein